MKLQFVLTVAILVAATTAPSLVRAQLPITGVAVPELSRVDQTMVDFMGANGIESGLLGIMYQGEVVYHRGFGWQDRAKTIPMPPNGMMRLASVTKPITAAAVRQLIGAGELTGSQRAVDTGQPGGGVIQLAPLPGLGDQRIGDITVNDLLRHRGGWDRRQAPDYTWQDREVMNTLGLQSPPEVDDKIRYILGKPLEHDPGTTYAYSNEGYVLLGEIVETVTGQDLVDVFHERVFAPIGVPSREVELGRTLPEFRNRREPWYQSTFDGLATNLFDLDGPRVPWPDGGWHHEARVGNGGLIASTKAILALLNHYFVSGDSIGLPLTGLESPSWRRNHTGSLNGTNTLARQRGDGIDYVVLFNERPLFGPSYASMMREILDELLDELDVWPSALIEPGDGDGDAWLTEADIDVFRTAVQLGDEEEFLRQFPGGHYLALDFTGDGAVTMADADGFVEYMRWSGFSEAELVMVPEPRLAISVLFTIGTAWLFRGRRRRVHREC